MTIPEFKVGDYVITMDWDTSTWKYIAQITDITTEWEYPIITKYGRFRKDWTKLWTLEEADDDELVWSRCDNVCKAGIKDYYKQVTIIKAEIAKKDKHSTYKPYIGQTPKQLGLEK